MINGDSYAGGPLSSDRSSSLVPRGVVVHILVKWQKVGRILLVEAT